jgi:hypothetical protein
MPSSVRSSLLYDRYTSTPRRRTFHIIFCPVSHPPKGLYYNQRSEHRITYHKMQSSTKSAFTPNLRFPFHVLEVENRSKDGVRAEGANETRTQRPTLNAQCKLKRSDGFQDDRQYVRREAATIEIHTEGVSYETSMSDYASDLSPLNKYTRPSSTLGTSQSSYPLPYTPQVYKSLKPKSILPHLNSPCKPISSKPVSPLAPYAAQHANPQGPGDARPTAPQVLKDSSLIGTLPNLIILITGTTSGIGVETA